jgi:hypothetical protein
MSTGPPTPNQTDGDPSQVFTNLHEACPAIPPIPSTERVGGRERSRQDSRMVAYPDTIPRLVPVGFHPRERIDHFPASVIEGDRLAVCGAGVPVNG